MMLDTLERARAQCIAYYVCNGDELTEVKNGNYEERCGKAFDDYRLCCKKFADRICDSMAHYSKLDEHEREVLIDEFTKSLDNVMNDIEIIFSELGMRIGFTMALDLGLDSYKAKRGIGYE